MFQKQGICIKNDGFCRKCIANSPAQTWAYSAKTQAIESAGHCLDIDNYSTKKGGQIWAYPCAGSNVKRNEAWGLSAATITSLQPNTPFCVGASGTTAGSSAVLDDCSAPSASFKSGFTKTSGTVNYNTTAIFWGKFLLKMQSQWRIAPEK